MFAELHPDGQKYNVAAVGEKPHMKMHAKFGFGALTPKWERPWMASLLRFFGTVKSKWNHSHFDVTD